MGALRQKLRALAPQGNYMPKSKRFIGTEKQVDKTKTYPIDEAVELVKKTSTVKFDASVELHVRLGIDPKKSDQQVRGSVILPHGTGKKQIIAVFAEEGKIKEAKEAEADIIGNEELIAKIKQTGKIDFDVAVATPEMMKKLAPAAKILGPRGLMPSPKDGTVTSDIGKAVRELKMGKINFKNDDTGNLHLIIGKVSFEKNKLKENLELALEAINKAKPTTIKGGTYIKNIVLTSSMGPGIKLAV